MKNIVEILENRGLIEAMTSDDLGTICEKPQTVYCGFDPTSDSLHLGNMICLMSLSWFQKCGHTPVAIIGGATGMIGDPSGKSHERKLLNPETIQKNLEGIKKNLESFLDFDHPTCKPVILNNYDWFKEFTFVEFLRDVGKHFRLGPMLAKESVRNRIESEEGMSFTEFSYQLLQGYDFLHLLDHYKVTIQVGGSDQWGNITAGKDLVRKLRGTSVHGLTFPLLTTSTGQKFGKSEKEAIWLSDEKLSPYEFYQYLFRVSDDDVIKMMRILTFMDLDEIKSYETQMQQSDYVPNTAQKRLAQEITKIVHGDEGLKKAEQVTAAAKPGAKTALNADVLETIAKDMPSKQINLSDVLGIKLIDLIVACNLQHSKGDARRMIRNKGVYLNNAPVIDENYVMNENDLIEGRLALLALGKKKKILLRIKS